MLTPFRKIYTLDKDLTTVQTVIENTLQSFEKMLLDGILIEVDFTGIVVQDVQHKLGRKPKGWIIVDKNAKTDVWASFSDNKTITLHVDNNVVLKLYVF